MRPLARPVSHRSTLWRVADLLRAAARGDSYHWPMPVVLRYKGFRFFFYSNEGSPREQVHIHVLGAEGEAKFKGMA